MAWHPATQRQGGRGGLGQRRAAQISALFRFLHGLDVEIPLCMWAVAIALLLVFRGLIFLHVRCLFFQYGNPTVVFGCVFLFLSVLIVQPVMCSVNVASSEPIDHRHFQTQIPSSLVNMFHLTQLGQLGLDGLGCARLRSCAGAVQKVAAQLPGSPCLL